MAACGADNSDMPGAYSCEYPAGHDRIWRYGAWHDHGAPSREVWWVVAPYTDEQAATVAKVVEDVRSNLYVKDLLAQELLGAGWILKRISEGDTEELVALRHGAHSAVEHPEYRAAGYTVFEPGNIR